MNIVFLDRDTISPQARLRTLSFAHEWKEYGASVPPDVAARIADADIVITNKARIDARALAGADRLKFIAIGYR